MIMYENRDLEKGKNPLACLVRREQNIMGILEIFLLNMPHVSVIANFELIFGCLLK